MKKTKEEVAAAKKARQAAEALTLGVRACVLKALGHQGGYIEIEGKDLTVYYEAMPDLKGLMALSNLLGTPDLSFTAPKLDWAGCYYEGEDPSIAQSLVVRNCTKLV